MQPWPPSPQSASFRRKSTIPHHLWHWNVLRSLAHLTAWSRSIYHIPRYNILAAAELVLHDYYGRLIRCQDWSSARDVYEQVYPELFKQIANNWSEKVLYFSYTLSPISHMYSTRNHSMIISHGDANPLTGQRNAHHNGGQW